jgi:hypothetical protein
VGSTPPGATTGTGASGEGGTSRSFGLDADATGSPPPSSGAWPEETADAKPGDPPIEDTLGTRSGAGGSTGSSSGGGTAAGGSASSGDPDSGS